jgi:heme A synthase
MTSKRFERYLWVVLSYTIIVIVWGAFVRAMGSGAQVVAITGHCVMVK